MNDELNTKIAEAEMKVECIGMQNIAGLSHEETIKLKAEYHNAIDDLIMLRRKREFIQVGDITKTEPLK